MAQALCYYGANWVHPSKGIGNHSRNLCPLQRRVIVAAVFTYHDESSESHSRSPNDTVYTKGYLITMQFIHFPRSLISIFRASLALVILALTLAGPAVAYPLEIAFNPQPDPPGVAFNPQPDPPGVAFNPQPDPPGGA